MRRLPVHIWIREANASPAEVVGYFTELARYLDEKPQKMRLTIESAVSVFLDFNPSDGHPTVAVGGETMKFNLRHRWIPEHDVPLELGPASMRRMRCTTLLIDPVDGNRFRVRRPCVPVVQEWMYALAAVAGILAAVTLHSVALCVSGLLFLLLFVRFISLWYNSRLKHVIN